MRLSNSVPDELLAGAQRTASSHLKILVLPLSALLNPAFASDTGEFVQRYGLSAGPAAAWRSTMLVDFDFDEPSAAASMSRYAGSRAEENPLFLPAAFIAATGDQDRGFLWPDLELIGHRIVLDGKDGLAFGAVGTLLEGGTADTQDSFAPGRAFALWQTGDGLVLTLERFDSFGSMDNAYCPDYDALRQGDGLRRALCEFFEGTELRPEDSLATILAAPEILAPEDSAAALLDLVCLGPDMSRGEPLVEGLLVDVRANATLDVLKLARRGDEFRLPDARSAFRWELADQWNNGHGWDHRPQRPTDADAAESAHLSGANWDWSAVSLGADVVQDNAYIAVRQDGRALVLNMEAMSAGHDYPGTGGRDLVLASLQYIAHRSRLAAGCRALCAAAAQDPPLRQAPGQAPEPGRRGRDRTGRDRPDGDRTGRDGVLREIRRIRADLLGAQALHLRLNYDQFFAHRENFGPRTQGGHLRQALAEHGLVRASEIARLTQEAAELLRVQTAEALAEHTAEQAVLLRQEAAARADAARRDAKKSATRSVSAARKRTAEAARRQDREDKEWVRRRRTAAMAAGTAVLAVVVMAGAMVASAPSPQGQDVLGPAVGALSALAIVLGGALLGWWAHRRTRR